MVFLRSAFLDIHSITEILTQGECEPQKNNRTLCVLLNGTVLSPDGPGLQMDDFLVTSRVIIPLGCDCLQIDNDI